MFAEILGAVAGPLLSGILGAKNQSDAAESASYAQTEAARQGIEAKNKRFEEIKQLLAPYVQAGYGALGQQQNLLGLSGQPQQQAAIQQLEQSPMYSSLLKQGENAILQNASATGGLRGGNIQSALMRFRPQLLNQLIEQQYQRLGGLTQLGQQSAAGQADFAQQLGDNTAELLQQSGAAQAGGILGEAKAMQGLYNLPAKFAGYAAGLGGGLLGGSTGDSIGGGLLGGYSPPSYSLGTPKLRSF